MEQIFNNHDPQFYIDGILSGNIAVLSRAITLVESQKKEHSVIAQKIIEGIIHKSGNSFRLGITGVPGVGKSTFIESFGKEIIIHGHKLAVLAVDPSSTKSKGSILGDKTRMEELSVHENVFIRPSPSSGTLGGVSHASYETVLLCEAAGFDFIIIETVGVGQSEITVSGLVDFFLLLMLAGAGDELQGIKRGIMEMADAVVITKADGDNLQKAKSARAEYAHAMHLFQASESGWIPKTMLSSGLDNSGNAEIYNMLSEYKRLTKANGFFYSQRKSQQYDLLLNIMDEQLKQRFFSNELVKSKLEALKIKNVTSAIHPFSVANEILNAFLNDQKLSEDSKL